MDKGYLIKCNTTIELVTICAELRNSGVQFIATLEDDDVTWRIDIQ